MGARSSAVCESGWESVCRGRDWASKVVKLALPDRLERWKVVIRDLLSSHHAKNFDLFVSNVLLGLLIRKFTL